MNFKTWVEVDGQACTPEFSWFAVTRIRCDGAAWISDDPPNAVGTGATQCNVPTGVHPGPPSVSNAIELLRSDSTLDRLRAGAAIRTTAADIEHASHDRGMVVRELMRLADEGANHGIQSSQMIALNLLGVLAAQEATHILMRHLLTPFARSIVSQRDRPPSTVSAKALASLSVDAVPAIVERADTAADDEWFVLQHVFRLIDDQGALRQAICAALDSGVGERAEQRLASVMP